MKFPRKRKNISKYDRQLKIAIAREYLSSNLGYKGLGIKYGIAASTVQGFVKWYQKKYPLGVQDQEMSINREAPLGEDSLQVIALQMLIENASKELGVDIVKKFGTKQPGK